MLYHTDLTFVRMIRVSRDRGRVPLEPQAVQAMPNSYQMRGCPVILSRSLS